MLPPYRQTTLPHRRKKFNFPLSQRVLGYFDSGSATDDCRCTREREAANDCADHKVPSLPLPLLSTRERQRHVDRRKDRIATRKAKCNSGRGIPGEVARIQDARMRRCQRDPEDSEDSHYGPSPSPCVPCIFARGGRRRSGAAAIAVQKDNQRFVSFIH